jgi:hypothetical protein
MRLMALLSSAFGVFFWTPCTITKRRPVDAQLVELFAEGLHVGLSHGGAVAFEQLKQVGEGRAHLRRLISKPGEDWLLAAVIPRSLRKNRLNGRVFPPER